jgi:hypothetical protein
MPHAAAEADRAAGLRIRRAVLAGVRGLPHDRSARRLETRVPLMPNVMVTSVPWQLNSSPRLKTLGPPTARRGLMG